MRNEDPYSFFAVGESSILMDTVACTLHSLSSNETAGTIMMPQIQCPIKLCYYSTHNSKWNFATRALRLNEARTI